MNQDEIRAYFLDGANQLGLKLSSNQLDQLSTYLSELQRWNAKINLTGLKKEREIIVKHFLDSMTPLRNIQPNKEETWMDIGTGAGFPGLVLKIVKPELKLTLLEPTQKKCSFLHHVIGLLGLSDVIILRSRIEEISKTEKKYNLLMTRALSPKLVLEKGLNLLKKDGRFLFFQAHFDTEYWEALLSKQKNLKLEQVLSLSLPFNGHNRSLIIIRVL